MYAQTCHNFDLLMPLNASNLVFKKHMNGYKIAYKYVAFCYLLSRILNSGYICVSTLESCDFFSKMIDWIFKHWHMILCALLVLFGCWNISLLTTCIMNITLILECLSRFTTIMWIFDFNSRKIVKMFEARHKYDIF